MDKVKETSEDSLNQLFVQIRHLETNPKYYLIITKSSTLMGTKEVLLRIAREIEDYFMDEDFVKNGEPK